MQASTLRTACDQRPFQPFGIVLADGSRMSVPHPEFISLDPEGRVLIVWKKGSVPMWVDVPSITAIDFGMRSHQRPKSGR